MPGGQLARVFHQRDFTTMSELLLAEFPNPQDIYQGAWIGLNSPDPFPDQGGPQSGVAAGNWQWAEGSNSSGLPATFAEGTDFVRWGQGNGFLIDETQPCAAPCAGRHNQPDNSGGRQRCVLIAVGAIPPTPTSPFYDDQTCTGGVFDGVSNDRECPRTKKGIGT